MKIPLMQNRAKRTIAIPDLSGGINLRDSVSQVLDNQLTYARNVWFNDGVLKTRPGIDNMEHFEDESWKNADIKPHEIFYTVSGEVCRLFSAETDTHIYFFWIGKDKFIELSSIETDCKNFFVVQKDKTLYCFLRSGTVYKCDIGADEIKWEPVPEEEFYAPLVMMTCNTPGGMNTFQKENDIALTGVAYEGYNLLGKYYRMAYSTVNKDLFVGAGDNYKQPATYELLHWVSAGTKVTVKVYLPEAEYDLEPLVKNWTHEVTITNPDEWNIEEYDKDNPPGDGIIIKVMGRTLVLWDIVNDNQKFFEELDFIKENNMEITAPGPYDEKQLYKIFNMSCATWFGGAAEGINGGTRLFLGGNESEPNLVCYSDLNNPLYFPENNYFYVGESTSPVTAFGKQSDMLVIFKDNETYYTQYNRNTSITAEAVMNQSVIDIAASSVYFPLTLINANIGCDCPDTVELCRNRLVWTNSNGRVYTLVSNNNFNERNIFEIGEMIHRKLKTEKNLKNARSADWDGYYLLQVQNRIFILDYNSYGYQYIQSYSKTEDANLRIPWYYWDFELKAGNLQSTALALVDGALLLVESGTYGIFKAEFNEEAAYDYLIYSTDTSLDGYRTIPHPIKSEAQTKLFEFGAQGYYKNVDKVVLSVGNNGGVPINVSFITDMGTEETEIVPDGGQTETYTPGYVKSMQQSPRIRQVERFGVKLSCNGPLAVDGITLTYRVTGGAR